MFTRHGFTVGQAINVSVITYKGNREAQRKIHGTLSLLAFCHPIMVFKARAKNIPGLVPKQMEILEREKRFKKKTSFYKTY